MAKKISLTIDGKEVKVDEGVNLIDAAAEAGVHIPNLCYIKGMKGIGACRLCLVELEGGKAPVIACNTKAKDDMKVVTNTEKVNEVRKFVLDLVLSMHPLDCMTCTKAGVCTLQKYAYDFGIKESSFTRKKFGYPTDESNPFIKRDPEYCILCGRCIRACKAQGTEVLEFYGRGVGAKVVTGKDKPLQESNCTFCGSCVDACPVNALLEADRWRKGREWEYAKTASVCVSCGCGCALSVSTKDGEVVKVNSGAPDGAAERFICAIGRFGFESMKSDMRVMSPMKRVDGKLQETTWEDALGTVAEKLTAAGKDAAFVSTATIMNEDAALLAQLAGDVVKTQNVNSTVSLYSGDEALKGGGADLEKADLFVLAGINPCQWKRVLPAMDAIIRKRMNNGGAKLIVINSGESKIAASAAAFLSGDEAKMLAELAQALISKGVKAPKEMVSALASVDPSDAAMTAADIFIAAKSPVIISAPSLYKAAANLSLLKGDAVALPYEANAKGVVMMGLSAEGIKFSNIISGHTKVLYSVGKVPVSKRPNTDFLVVQSSLMTDLATQADIVLPSSAALESEGTIIDYLGRIREIKKALDPAGSSLQHGEIFSAVAKAMGKSLKKVKDTDVKKAAKTKGKATFSPFVKDAGFDTAAETFLAESNRSVVKSSRLLWLEELQTSVVA